jgi:hypothetical protein
VSNRWRNSLYKYEVNVLRNSQNNAIVDSVQSTLLAEYPQICNNPGRLALDQTDGGTASVVFVTCGQGGMVARLDPATGAIARTRLGGGGTALPGTGASFAGGAAVSGGRLYVGTSAVNRGQLSAADTAGVPAVTQAAAAPVIDPASGHVVNPGALFDQSQRSGFEDLSSDVLVLEGNLTQNTQLRATDSLSAELNLQGAQRLLDGTAPQALTAFTAAGQQHLLVAFSGNNLVQELVVDAGTGALSRGTTYYLGGGNQLQGPLGVADVTVDLSGQCLFTADRQSDTMTIVPREGCSFGTQPRQIDLGYAYLGNQQLEFPATKAEAGELIFNFSGWSNNKQKSCALGCHVDETLSGGAPFGFATTAPGGARLDRGASAPLGGHGFFATGGTHSLLGTRSVFRSDFVRPSRDLNPGDQVGVVERGLVCGLSRNLSARVAAAGTDGSQGGCADVQTEINVPNANAIDNYVIQALAPRFAVADASEAVDIAELYFAFQVRRFPNPGAQLLTRGINPDAATIQRGQTLFGSSGAACSTCHAPDTEFRDGRRHGAQADFIARFVARYTSDPRVGPLPDGLLQAAQAISPADPDLTVNVPDLEAMTLFAEANEDESTIFFRPDGRILDDALNSEQESARLAEFKLELQGFGGLSGLIGQPYGVSSWETPSLRGVWDRQSFLHDGRAFDLREVILPPGHAALNPNGPARFGEVNLGYAFNSSGSVDVHGKVTNLSAADVAALIAYVNTIE